jgi:GT2 family glycosyltransferase
LNEFTGPLISIVILNYNAEKFLDECISSIYKTEKINFEIILVDNASTDKSYRECTQKFPGIKLIENKKNLGYCEGNNVGIRASKGEFIVVLNPDTVVTPTWLSELIHTYQENGEGIYQPKILATTDHDMLLSSGQFIQLFGFGYSRGKGEKHIQENNGIEKIGYASGTCLFTSKAILEKLEYFDPFLFAYHDDLDLCWRAAMFGISSFYVPTSVIFHPIEGYSFKWSKFKFYLMERNRQYCLLTHFTNSSYLKMLPSLILVDIAVSLFYLKKGMFITKIKTSLNILKNLRKISKKYKKIQSNRTSSDKEILNIFQNQIQVPKWVASEENSESFNNLLNKLSKISQSFL